MEWEGLVQGLVSPGCGVEITTSGALSAMLLRTSQTARVILQSVTEGMSGLVDNWAVPLTYADPREAAVAQICCLGTRDFGVLASRKQMSLAEGF